MESETRQFILQCHFTLTETRVAANMKYCHGIIATTREIEGNLSARQHGIIIVLVYQERLILYSVDRFHFTNNLCCIYLNM